MGCIPKKLMHQAALLGHSMEDARMFGWEFDQKGYFDNNIALILLVVAVGRGHCSLTGNVLTGHYNVSLCCISVA